MMSYIGNVIFLFIGGYFIDRMKKKTFLFIMICIWMSALLCYVLTENYTLLIVGMIFSLGASTMISTTVNVITPLLFITPAFFTNFFNFTLGIGISGVQKFGGKVANDSLSTPESPADLSGWHILNLMILVLAAVAALLLLISRFPEENSTAPKKRKTAS